MHGRSVKGWQGRTPGDTKQRDGASSSAVSVEAGEEKKGGAAPLSSSMSAHAARLQPTNRCHGSNLSCHPCLTLYKCTCVGQASSRWKHAQGPSGCASVPQAAGDTPTATCAAVCRARDDQQHRLRQLSVVTSGTKTSAAAWGTTCLLTLPSREPRCVWGNTIL